MRPGEWERISASESFKMESAGVHSKDQNRGGKAYSAKVIGGEVGLHCAAALVLGIAAFASVEYEVPEEEAY
jgi:hypothetical protein